MIMDVETKQQRKYNIKRPILRTLFGLREAALELDRKYDNEFTHVLRSITTHSITAEELESMASKHLPSYVCGMNPQVLQDAITKRNQWLEDHKGDQHKHGRTKIKEQLKVLEALFTNQNLDELL